MKQIMVTPCGRTRNSKGELYTRRGWWVHVDNCNSKACRELSSEVRSDPSLSRALAQEHEREEE